MTTPNAAYLAGLAKTAVGRGELRFLVMRGDAETKIAAKAALVTAGDKDAAEAVERAKQVQDTGGA